MGLGGVGAPKKGLQDLHLPGGPAVVLQSLQAPCQCTAVPCPCASACPSPPCPPCGTRWVVPFRSDDEKRKQYDTFGKQGMGGGGPGSGFHANFDPRDMFKTFFKTEEGAGDSFFSEFFQSGGDGGGNTMHFSFTTSGPAGGGGAGGMPDMGNIFGNIFGGEGGDPFGGAGAGMFGGEGADLGSMFRQAGASGKKRRGAGANPFGNAQARKPGKQAGGRPRSQ